ncbi:hypothetical protein D3C87_1010760 [compost metagenome]
MGVYEARHDDHALRVDALGRFGLDVGGDRDDALAFDQDVAAAQVADGGVHAQDPATGQEGAVGVHGLLRVSQRPSCASTSPARAKALLAQAT